MEKESYHCMWDDRWDSFTHKWAIRGLISSRGALKTRTTSRSSERIIIVWLRGNDNIEWWR